MSFYAHSLENQSPENWETMAQHEQAVATRCAQFLKRIHPDFEAWGDLLGRWHDLGKYSSDFQKYILDANNILDQVYDLHQDEVKGRVDHSTAAAHLSVESFKLPARFECDHQGSLLRCRVSNAGIGFSPLNSPQSTSPRQARRWQKGCRRQADAGNHGTSRIVSKPSRSCRSRSLRHRVLPPATGFLHQEAQGA